MSTFWREKKLGDFFLNQLIENQSEVCNDKPKGKIFNGHVPDVYTNHLPRPLKPMLSGNRKLVPDGSDNHKRAIEYNHVFSRLIEPGTKYLLNTNTCEKKNQNNEQIFRHTEAGDKRKIYVKLD